MIGLPPGKLHDVAGGALIILVGAYAVWILQRMTGGKGTKAPLAK